MASLKGEKPVSAQPTPVKKEPAKLSSSAPKAPAANPAPKKAEQKSGEPKKKASGSCKAACK